MMETVARARFMRGSARKMRQVVDLVRGKSVDEALQMLSVLPKAAATPVLKTVKSAAANALAAEGTAKLRSEQLSIKKIFVDGGPMMKRIRAMGMGRAYRINKKLCHLTVVLEGEPEETASTGGRKTGAARAEAAKEKTGAAGKPAANKAGGKTPARKQAAGAKAPSKGKGQGATRRKAPAKKGN
jgi:large subunit ribosomal protein L22